MRRGAVSVQGPAVDLEPSTLMAQAAESVGHDDWGDTGFTEPLSVLVAACRATGQLNATGWQVLRSVLLRHLRNRLHVQAYLRRHPDAGERPLGSPLVITGLPRTGTSLLHNLLAQDPAHRYLALWEALRPVPPDAGDDVDQAALVRQAERWLERFYALAPGFRAVHPLTPRGPEECDALLQNAFASQHFDDMFDARDYSRWFQHTTLDREYSYYALQLRILTSDPRRRWLLKSPGHLGHLGSLLVAVPGAIVVHCHRDPVQAVPSYASLVATVRGPNSDAVSPAAVGDQALSRCCTALRRGLAAREAAGDGHVVDVSYPALVADPVATVAGIYRQLERPLDDAVEAAMRTWVTRHPADRHGRHRYDPERFGLPADRVAATFADYRQRFATWVER